MLQIWGEKKEYLLEYPKKAQNNITNTIIFNIWLVLF